jgi:hypothetical protein
MFYISSIQATKSFRSQHESGRYREMVYYNILYTIREERPTLAKVWYYYTLHRSGHVLLSRLIQPPAAEHKT